MSAIDLLREAAMILRDPAGCNPYDVDKIASELEIIAARAAEMNVSGLLEVEAMPIIMPAAGPGSRRPDRASLEEYEHNVTTRFNAYRLLAQFLRASGFDREEIPTL